MAVPSAKNYLIVLLSLTTLAAGAFAWSQYLTGIRLRGQLLTGGARADFEKQLQALQKRRNELEAEVADLRSRRAAAVAAASSAQSAGAEADPPRAAGRFGRQNRMNFISNLMDDPQFGKLWADQEKTRVAAAFAPLIKRLNLTPDQATQFQNLMAERQASVMDAIAAARSEGVTDRAEMAGVIQQATSQVDSQLQALLGPDGYSQYQNYVQTQPQRNQVNQLQLGLINSGNAPLQDYQVQQLTQILAQGSPAAAGGGRGNTFFAEFGGAGVMGPPVSGPPISQDAVNQAAGILSPAQLQQLQAMQQEQAAQRQLFDLVRQNFGGGGATQAAPPAAATGGATPAPAGAPRG